MLLVEHLRSWLAVVEAGSFHAAARQLGIAQPTVSHHVRKLEAALGATLLERKDCRPTSAGWRLRPCAEAFVRLETRARAVVQATALAVGAGSNVGIYLLMPHLRRFEQAHPAIRVDLHIAPNPQVFDRLLEGSVDLAVLEWWEARDGFEARPWLRQRLVAIAPPRHPWAGRKRLSIDELAREPLLGGEPGSGTGRLLSAALAGRRRGARPAALPVRNLGSTEAVKRAVAAGLGLSLVLESAVADEVRAGTLAAIPIETDGPALEKTIYLAHPTALDPTAPALRMAELLGAAAP